MEIDTIYFGRFNWIKAEKSEHKSDATKFNWRELSSRVFFSSITLFDHDSAWTVCYFLLINFPMKPIKLLIVSVRVNDLHWKFPVSFLSILITLSLFPLRRQLQISIISGKKLNYTVERLENEWILWRKSRIIMRIRISAVWYENNHFHYVDRCGTFMATILI